MRFISPKKRESPEPRNFFSRREQYRMLALVFGLALVVFAIRKAADPATWSWLVGEQVVANAAIAPSASAEDTSIDTRRMPGNALPQGVFLTPLDSEPTAKHQLDRPFPGVQASWMASLRDDTVFRSAEAEAWYGMLALVRDTPAETFVRHSLGRVGHTQLFRQPKVYRGRSIRLSGVVRRCHRIDAHSNEQGITQYFRCWFWPDGSANPIVIYSLELPRGFPQGMSLNEYASLDGLFYKRWAYKAVDDVRVAPLVIAKSWEWTPRGAQSRQLRLEPRHRSLFPFIGIRTATSLAAQEVRSDEPQLSTFLELFELNDDARRRMTDGEALDENDLRFFEQCAEAVARLPAHLEAQWEEYDVDLGALRSDPSSNRWRLISLHGRLDQLQRISPEIGSGPNTPSFKATIAPPLNTEPQSQIEIYAFEVPGIWQPLIETEWNERIRATGMFLKRTADGRLQFIAKRIRWHPTSHQQTPHVHPHHVVLGNLGFDVGRLYDVNGVGKLTAADAPAFYELLSSLKRATAGGLQAAQPFEPSIVDLLQDPESQRGRLFRFTGNARRILKIYVDDPNQRQLYGLDYYYEVELFIDPDAIVRVQGEDGTQSRVFATYPIVFCCTELPPGCPTGEETNTAMSVTGAYLKTWQYRSQFVSDLSRNGQAVQSSPMLVGKAPVMIMTGQSASQTGLWIGVTFVGILVVLSSVIWRLNAADADIARRRRAAREEIPPRLE